MYTYRLTTNGMLHSYRANLQNSYKTLFTASEKVQTGRNFLSYAEDPASATLAFQLRREHWQVNTQMNNNSTVLARFSQAYTTYDNVRQDLARQVQKVNDLRGLNDPTGSGRQPLGQSTLAKADSVVQAMNVEYAGIHIFAGADGHNAPLEWQDLDMPVYEKDENGKLKMVPDPTDPNKKVAVQKVDDDGNPVTERRTVLCYRGIPVDVAEGTKEYDQLQDLLNETTYVDIGLGVQENADGTPVKSTVYNSSLNALEFLDFGLDEEGDPKNIASLMRRIGEVLSAADDMDGGWVEQEDGSYTNTSASYEELYRLTQKLETAMGKSDVEFTELTTKAEFLNSNNTRLKSDFDALNTQILDVEEIDPVAAITALSWAQYCYNAGLKIGTSILTDSLIDYMR